jgi:hypothetical protein
MDRFLFACFAAAGLYGFAAAAHATPVQDTSQPIIVTAATPQQDGMPSMLAKLHIEVQMLQTEVQTLGHLECQDSGDTQYSFSVAPPPNPDNAPIPSGG